MDPEKLVQRRTRSPDSWWIACGAIAGQMNSKSKTGMFEEFSKRLRVPNLVAGASHSIMDMAAKRKMQLNKKFIRGVAPEEDLASSLPRSDSGCK